MMFIDYASGKDAKSPELNRMIDYVRRGDTVIVEPANRFARNTRDLLDLMNKLTDKGVGFISKKETINTQTSAGKFMLTVFDAVAELERTYILKRQREGIAIAKALGKYNGMPKRDYPRLTEQQEMNRRGKITAAAAMKKLGMSPAGRQLFLGHFIKQLVITTLFSTFHSVLSARYTLTVFVLFSYYNVFRYIQTPLCVSAPAFHNDTNETSPSSCSQRNSTTMHCPRAYPPLRNSAEYRTLS